MVVNLKPFQEPTLFIFNKYIYSQRIYVHIQQKYIHIQGIYLYTQENYFHYSTKTFLNQILSVNLHCVARFGFNLVYVF